MLSAHVCFSQRVLIGHVSGDAERDRLPEEQHSPNQDKGELLLFFWFNVDSMLYVTKHPVNYSDLIIFYWLSFCLGKFDSKVRSHCDCIMPLGHLTYS